MADSLFLKTFGDYPLNRVLDFLLVHEEFDYSMTDIAHEAGVGYATLKLFWPRLERQKIVKNTRIVGNAKMYRLNYENPVVESFRNFYWAVTKAATDKLLQAKHAA